MQKFSFRYSRGVMETSIQLSQEIERCEETVEEIRDVGKHI